MIFNIIIFSVLLQGHVGPRVPETGDRHGHHVGSGRAVVDDRRTGLHVVHDGPDKHVARGADIHRGRLPAAGVDGREAHVPVPAFGQPVGRRQRQVVHVQRDAVHRQRYDADQTGGDAVLRLTIFTNRSPPRPHASRHVIAPITRVRDGGEHVRAAGRAIADEPDERTR